MGAHRLICGDALVALPTLPDASVQLVVVDPPYYQNKLEYLGEKLTWDRQWPTREAYLDWLRQLAKEWRRVLTPSGSLYCFASPQMAAHVEVMLSDYFTVLNHVVWQKADKSGNGQFSKACKETMRMFFPQTERILFCEQRNADSKALGESRYAGQCEQLHGHVFEPIRAYLDGERKRAGIDKAACNKACGFAEIAGGMASRHYFSPSQWCLPTREHYKALQHLFNAQGRRPTRPFLDYHPAESSFLKFHAGDDGLSAVWRQPAPVAFSPSPEALRADYEALRRPFAVSATSPFTDCWTFYPVPAGAGKHPCEKPLPILRHIIQTSSRPDDTVLDCCAGSFSMLEAARQCGRRSIGIEQDVRWYRQGIARLSQMELFATPEEDTA